MGGYFAEIGGVPANNIARWNGAQWNAMGGGVSSLTVGNQIYSMKEYNNQLFVSGNNITDTSNLGMTGLLIWNGISWNSPALRANIQGNKMILFNNKLFIGGMTVIHDSLGNNIGFADLISYYNSNWIFYDCLNMSSSTYSIDAFDNYIYLGGSFNLLCDSVQANGIARFSEDSINGMHDVPFANSEVSVYPNPANESITVEWNNTASEIELQDVLGRVIIKQSVTPAERRKELSIANLKPGFYLVTLKSDKGIAVQKIIKQ